MTGALILWGHALAALAFAVVGIDRQRRGGSDIGDRSLVIALFTTACWALAVAGIGSGDIATQLVAAIRDIAWLSFMAVTMRASDRLGIALAAVFLMAIGMALAMVMLALVGTLHLVGDGAAMVVDAQLLVRMMGAIASLVLLVHLDRQSARVRPVVYKSYTNMASS